MKNYYEYEELGITVIKKINIKKVVVLILCLVILISLLMYVFVINKKMKQAQESDTLISSEEENIKEEQQEEKEEEIIKLPQLTEIGRENLNNIYKSSEKIAYLTFDDGPSEKITPQILKTLDDYEIKATFFLLGKM